MRIVSAPPGERARARIAPLSVLPVFLDLHGRKVVVAGGSDAAAWKAELLAAAGAEVHVYAPRDEIGEEMARLLSTGPASASHVRYDGEWEAAGLAGAALAVADARCDRKAHAFAAAARLAGVPCNLVDRPAGCDFQFGSIVNRSPVVVGISSSGTAPILAQAVRRRIEALLPPSLAEWAGLARRLRGSVRARLPGRLQRRAFWEGFAERAFGPVPGGGGMSGLVRQLGEIASGGAIPAGRVTFVDAGPGDAGLLTLKAVRALQAADVILHDARVADEVLELARREAKRVLVPNRAACPDGAGDLMVMLARDGRQVVRLGSGDPRMGRRSGMEIQRLRAEDVSFDVVPGVPGGTSDGVDVRYPAGPVGVARPRSGRRRFARS